MKTLRSATLCVMMGIFAMPAMSQSNTKNNPFASLPEKNQIATEFLAASMNLPVGEEMNVKLAKGFEFRGKVISNIQKYHNLQSVLFESTTDKTIFQISGQLNEDKTVTYVGKMLNHSSAEGLKIIKDESGNYFLTKFETGNIIQDCSYTH